MCLSYSRFLSVNPIVYCLIMSSDDDIPPMPPLETPVLFHRPTSQSNSGATSIQETSIQDHTMSQFIPSPVSYSDWNETYIPNFYQQCNRYRFTKMKDNDNTTDLSNTRSSNRQSVDSLYHNHTHDGKVDRRTFSMCGPNSMTCVSMSGTKELNIEDIYKEQDLRIGFTTRGKAPRKIMGDMQKFGWVIYTGVYVHHKEYVYNLSDEFSNLVQNKSMRMWHGIGGTERCIFKLDEFMLENLFKCLKETKCISKCFNDIHTLVLNKIPPFKDRVSMKNKSLVDNFGYVDEQLPHCDYGSTFCNDPDSMDMNI